MLAHVGSCWPPFFWWLLGIPEFVMGLKIDCLQQQSHNRAPWTILAWQVTKHTWIFGFQFSKLRMNSEKWLVLVSHVVSTDHIRDGWTNPARYHEVPAMLWRPCLRNGSFFFWIQPPCYVRALSLFLVLGRRVAGIQIPSGTRTWRLNIPFLWVIKWSMNGPFSIAYVSLLEGVSNLALSFMVGLSHSSNMTWFFSGTKPHPRVSDERFLQWWPN